MLKSSLPESVTADRIMAEAYNPVNPVKASHSNLSLLSRLQHLMKGDGERAALQASRCSQEELKSVCNGLLIVLERNISIMSHTV